VRTSRIWPVLIIGLLLSAPALAGGLDDLQAGRAALAQGNLDEAIDLLGRAIAAGDLPRDQLAAAHYARGLALEKKNWLGDAQREFGRAVWLDRKNREYLEKFRELSRRYHPRSF